MARGGPAHGYTHVQCIAEPSSNGRPVVSAETSRVCTCWRMPIHMSVHISTHVHARVYAHVCTCVYTQVREAFGLPGVQPSTICELRARSRCGRR